jgi:hypothetical protein
MHNVYLAETLTTLATIPALKAKLTQETTQLHNKAVVVVAAVVTLQTRV